MYFINEEMFLCMREITPGPALAEHTCDTAVSSVVERYRDRRLGVWKHQAFVGEGLGGGEHTRRGCGRVEHLNMNVHPPPVVQGSPPPSSLLPSSYM